MWFGRTLAHSRVAQSRREAEFVPADAPLAEDLRATALRKDSDCLGRFRKVMDDGGCSEMPKGHLKRRSSSFDRPRARHRRNSLKNQTPTQASGRRRPARARRRPASRRPTIPLILPLDFEIRSRDGVWLWTLESVCLERHGHLCSIVGTLDRPNRPHWKRP